MRILIADDHDLVRDTIALLLKTEGIPEVSTASSLEEAMSLVGREGTFDLILLDYTMPGMDGLSGLSRMIEANGQGTVAIISGNAPKSVAEDAIAAGAIGFVPKTLPSKSMVSAVRFMIEGEVYAPFGFMNAAEDDSILSLSPRESDVLRGLCKGKSNKEIGLDLNLQEVTIKLHVKTLCRKLDAKNRTHAAMIARDRNLI